MILFTDITELYTPYQRLSDAALLVQGGVIVWIGKRDKAPVTADMVSLGQRGVLPGLVDSHTHLIWAGSRLEDYLQRAKGVSYESILLSGGGIHSTVRATQTANEDELYELAKKRAALFLAQGVTSLEVKSGYGLSAEHELKMLRVVQRLNQDLNQRFIPTLLAHVIPENWQRQDYIDMFCDELIPEVKGAGLASAVDVFCDVGAFTLAESRQILEAALKHQLQIKAHAEQLEHRGAAQLVAELQGLSADHLEQSTTADWQALAAAGTIGTALPGATIILQKPFPPLRAMWDAGVKVAIATDHNPGSSPMYSLLLCLQLGTALGGLSVEESLLCGTAHSADALGEPRLGRLEVGSPADFIVVDSHWALEPFYHWGRSLLQEVYIAGRCVYARDSAPEYPV